MQTLKSRRQNLKFSLRTFLLLFPMSLARNLGATGYLRHHRVALRRALARLWETSRELLTVEGAAASLPNPAIECPSRFRFVTLPLPHMRQHMDARFRWG